MAEEVKLMKGNEAIAHAAIRYGVDGYFGYPITPQSEILETLMAEMPWETTGMVVLQAESEVAAINMVYGGAGTGKRVMTSSSSPGVSLKQEGISYIAGAELPCLIVNVMRGGPGLGTILRRIRFRTRFQIQQSCHYSGRRYHRPDDGKSGIASFPYTPYRRRNHSRMPVGYTGKDSRP